MTDTFQPPSNPLPARVHKWLPTPFQPPPIPLCEYIPSKEGGAVGARPFEGGRPAGPNAGTFFRLRDRWVTFPFSHCGEVTV